MNDFEGRNYGKMGKSARLFTKICTGFQ